MKWIDRCGLALLGLFVLSAGCSTAPKTEAKREQLTANVESALSTLKAEDASLDGLLERSAGYAVFPSVGKGGLVAGGAYGKGKVYEGGSFVGFSDLKQATIGLQAGGQTYHEIIVFKDPATLNRFKTGQYALSANASGVAIKANAAAAADFNDGVIVFVKPEGGLMFEASIGGQKFSFVPSSESSSDMPPSAE